MSSKTIDCAITGSNIRHHNAYLECSSTPNTDKNTSAITIKLKIYSDSSGQTYNAGGVPFYLTVNGTKYTYDKPIDLRQAGTDTIFTHTQTINHNSDGKKTITVKLSANTSREGIATISADDTWVLDNIPRASTFSIPASVTLGESFIATINKADSSFSHIIRYTIGSYTVTSTKQSGASISIQTQEGHANAMPNSLSGIATVTCYTYNGSTLLGTTTKYITVKVPSSIVPSVSNLSAAVSLVTSSTVSAINSRYVQGKCKCKLTAIGITALYGAKITKVTVTSNRGHSYSTSSINSSGVATITTDVLTMSGSITWTIKATDSRGRVSTSKATTISVDVYAKPAITKFWLTRCDQDGTTNLAAGTFAKVTLAYSYSTINNLNNVAAMVKFKQNGTNNYGSDVSVSNGTVVTGPFLYDTKYDFTLSLTDAYGSVSKTYLLSTVLKTMNFLAGGKGAAIGKMAELADIFDVGWTTYLRKHLYVGYGSNDERSIALFSGDNKHQCRIYGGNSLSSTAIGVWDNNGFGQVAIYNDTDMLLSMMNSSLQLYGKNGSYGSVAKFLYTPVNSSGRVGTPIRIFIEPDTDEKRTVIRGDVDSSVYLGTAGFKFNTVFSTNSVSTSDRKLKNVLGQIDEAKAVEFTKRLNPVVNTLKNADSNNPRLHYSLIAQDVAVLAQELGLGDLALYKASVINEDGSEGRYDPNVPDEKLAWGLNYLELIPVIIKVLQYILRGGSEDVNSEQSS